MIGYNSHGHWAPTKEIYHIEEERGNKIDPLLLEYGYEAIWICRRQEDAVRYLDGPLEELHEISLDNALHLESLDDGDGGELWMRRIK